jgi:MoaA/NifB/PqqE/SkfB family radical SAM enzyme
VGEVYSALKAFQFPAQLDALRAGVAAAPVHVRIKPTNVCNHACYFCAYRSDAVTLGQDIQLRDRIGFEKMMEIAEDVIAMGVRAVTFSGGGEPLIYPRLAAIIDRLGAAGIGIGVLTNGSRLLGKTAEALACYGTWLRVSIDGWDGPSYARYRKVEESEFSRVLANLEAFAGRSSRCLLGASIIVDESNAGHVGGLCRQLKGVGVRSVKISPCIIADDGGKNEAYHARIRPLVARQIAVARTLEDGRFAVADHYHPLEEGFDKPYHRCPVASLLTVIGADLTVYSCQDKAYTASGALGSIRDRRFKELWFAPETQAALAAIDPARSCRHHCVADAKNRLINEYLALDQDHVGFV